MSTVLLFLALTPVPTASGEPTPVAILAERIAGKGAAAEEAFTELAAAAFAWDRPALYRRSARAVAALRSIAADRGPRANRAANLVQWRADALEDEAEETIGLKVLARNGGPLTLWTDDPPPTDGPHPIVLIHPADYGVEEVEFSCSGEDRLRTAAHLAEVAAVPGLVELSVSDAEEFTDAWLAPLARHPTLHTVRIEGAGLTAAGCRTLATIPNLWRVDLAGSPIGDDGLVALRAAPELSDFGSLADTKITDRGLAALAAVEGLELESLRGNPVTDAGFVQLPLRWWPPTENWGLDLADTRCGDGSLAHLRDRRDAALAEWGGDDEFGEGQAWATLDFSGTRVTDAGLEALAGITRITWLQLHRTAVTGTGFDAFRRAGVPLPDRIHLSEGAFDDAGCAALAAGRITDTLELRCPGSRVTDEGLRRLGRIARLRELEVGGPGVTDAGLAALAGCDDLFILNVVGGPSTGTGVGSLRGLPALEFVGLGADGTTDAGVAAVARLPELRSLSITAGHVTNRLFRELTACEGLVQLWVEDVPVAGPGLAALAALRPPVDEPGDLHSSDGCSLKLARIGLTDEILAGLPTLPAIDFVTLTGDPITADGVATFLANQPQVWWCEVAECPAARGGGPARIKAALAGRRPR